MAFTSEYAKAEPTRAQIDATAGPLRRGVRHPVVRALCGGAVGAGGVARALPQVRRVKICMTAKANRPADRFAWSCGHPSYSSRRQTVIPGGPSQRRANSARFRAISGDDGV